jgi:Family of unknown function (DUF6464)
MIFIGDSRCKYNALSAELRCAVNPCGPCEGCQDFEKVRERISVIGLPITPMTRREILAHKLKMKIFEFWAVARYPLGMLQVICISTVLGLLISNKYPVSKEHFFGLFKSSTRIVVYSFHLIRIYDVLTEFNVYERDRTTISKVFRMLEPLAWLGIFDATLYFIMKNAIQ